MSDGPKLKRCEVCNGRGALRCDCWPGDCICGWDDEPCEACEGTGWIDPLDYLDDCDWDNYPPMDQPSGDGAQDGETEPKHIRDMTSREVGEHLFPHRKGKSARDGAQEGGTDG